MMKNDELTAKQKQALPILAAHPCIEEGCKAVGISTNCYYEWLKKPHFKEEMDRLRNELVESALDQLKVNSCKAVATLAKLLDKDDSPSVQRSAANDILNQVVKFRELQEFEHRISILEKQTKRTS